ncbi:nonribosomal peptide synthase [Apiospora arundinis]
MGKCTITREEADFTTLYDLIIHMLQSKSNGTVLSVKCSDGFHVLVNTKFITDTFANLLGSMVGAPWSLVKDLGHLSNAQIRQATAVAKRPDIPDQLPVTPNGKLNYAVLEALPLPENYSSSSPPSATPTESDNEDVAGVDVGFSVNENRTRKKQQLTAMETKLRAIWVGLVGPAVRAVDIGPRSNVFAVGGSSLLLVHLLHTVHRLLEVKVHLRVLREAPDLRAMAAAIEKQT